MNLATATAACLTGLAMLLPAGLSGQAAALRALLASDEAADWVLGAEAVDTFALAAFDTEARGLLAEALRGEHVASARPLILLAGKLGLLTELQALGRRDDLDRSTRQLVMLARVRAGDAERGDNLLANARALPVDDEFAEEVAPMIAYTRYRPAVDFLWGLVVVGSPTCTSLDPEAAGRVDCAYRIAEAIAPAVEGFPVALDFEGGFDVDDYPAALARIRAWYRAHAQTYRLTESPAQR